MLGYWKNGEGGGEKVFVPFIRVIGRYRFVIVFFFKRELRSGEIFELFVTRLFIAR